jgi:hypothetical protein
LRTFYFVPGFFNPELFLADFRSALGQCGRPSYPHPRWHRCLARAEELDTARALAARYAAQDAHQHRVSYFERLYDSTTTAKMNGQPLRVVAASHERNVGL